MKDRLESQIDDLYKLPLDEFTKARNTLAKTLPAGDKQDVARLPKPSVAMWVVNQLHWQDPPTYKALVDASEKLRTAHRSALAGRKVDTQKPDELHRTTLEKAFARATTIAQKSGTSLTDTVRDAVRRTLAALPTDETPGRLTREPPAAGFSLLTGIAPRAVEAKRDEQKEEPKLDARRQKLEEQRRRAAEAIARKAAERARKEEEKARKAQLKREREIQKAEQALREAEQRLAALKG